MGTPSLEGTPKTKSRNYRTASFHLENEPLSFINGDKDEFEEEGIEPLLPPLMFANPNIIVVDGIREYFKILGVENMHFFPAIYIDDNDEWHENYWFMYADERIDCWDRDKSLARPQKPDSVLSPRIDKFSLSTEVLGSIPLNNRLMFVMGDVSIPKLFVHQSIVSYLEEAQVTGWRAFKVSDYEFGMEF